jgi:HAD superfamily hydrolase (TIGR01490 family)
MSSHLVIFDLDHTLLRVNSSFCFGVYLYKKKYISLFSLVYCFYYYLKYKFFGLSLDSLNKVIFEKIFKYKKYSFLKSCIESFLDADFDKICNGVILNELEKRKKEGSRILILSASPIFIVDEIADRFGVSSCFASTYKKDSFGRLTDVLQTLDGESKLCYVRHFISQFNIMYENITFFSDSCDDLPLLNVVGNPICVNPSKKLKNICYKNNWKIIWS